MLQTVSVTCRVCRAKRTVTIDDSRPFPRSVTHHCRVCNRDRPLAVIDREPKTPTMPAEGSA